MGGAAGRVRRDAGAIPSPRRVPNDDAPGRRTVNLICGDNLYVNISESDVEFSKNFRASNMFALLVMCVGPFFGSAEHVPRISSGDECIYRVLGLRRART